MKKKPNGELKLCFRKKQSGKTYIAKQYYKLPLQITVPYYQDEDGTAFLPLLNMGGGVLGRDYFKTRILLEKDSRAVITNLSATSIYKAKNGQISLLENEFILEDGAVLEYLPGCSIPFKDSALRQRNVFRIKKNSFLFTVDFVTPGRLDMEEVFSFRSYYSDFRLYVEDKLLVRECADVDPNPEKLGRIGFMEGFYNYISVFVYCERIDESFVQGLQRICGMAEDVYCGCSQIDSSLITVKILGNNASNINGLIDRVWGYARESLLNKHKVDLRRS